MKTTIHTDSAPAAIGPYSQAQAFQELIFTSGQLPLVPETMAFPEGGIKEQSRQSLENLKAILEESGASIETVIKTTCFLSDMENFVAFNEVYTEVFGTENAPARSCVQAARLPKDALVEVEAIAYIAYPKK
ncbi:RidA family protein [Vibrio sp. HN007]|uniref:RidA family protein n=1 Tax=Vibrio iocasae TaxID=3098914 RepID=UPI0035D517E6